MSIYIKSKLMRLEQQESELLKKRQLMFQYRDEEKWNSPKQREWRAAIQRNTVNISNIRKEWREAYDSISD